jgi:hypothetical protein
MRSLLHLAPVIASTLVTACGDPTVITVHASGATLVAIDVGDGWQARPAGDVTFDQPDGLYRIARTCRADTGDTVFRVAAPGDPTEYDLDCPGDAGGVEVTFDVTGEVNGLFIGFATRYGSSGTVLVPPGTYDVVATQDNAQFEVLRAQVIRSVVISGPTRIPIDVTALGAPLEDVTVRSSEVIERPQVIGTTAGGTWFQLGSRGQRRLPAALRVPGDRHVLRAGIWLPSQVGQPRMRSEAVVPIEDAVVDVELPTTDAVATFTGSPLPTATWSTIDGWDAATLQVYQDNTYGVPGWSMSASVAALARGAALALPEPPPGWRPSWTVDLAAPYVWSMGLSRRRADGGNESVRTSGRVNSAP